LWELIGAIYRAAPVKVTALQPYLRNDTGEPLSMSQLYRYGENPKTSGTRLPAEYLPIIKTVFGPAAEKLLREWEWHKQQEVAVCRKRK